MKNRSTLIYGFLYIAVIPLFACIYFLLPNHFYHSTVMYEPSIESDRIYLVHGLQEALRNSVGPYQEKTRWRLDPKSLRVANLWVVNGVPTIEVHAQLPDRQGAAETLQAYWRLKLNMTSYLWYKEKSLYAVNFAPVEPIIEGDMPDASDFFVPPPFNRGIGKPPGFILIPVDLMDKLKAHVDAQGGFPSRATGSFDRMFYLSAMTATTVGYGDIVPVTRLARLLVAFEAILEIVIVGLFLNSLATRIAR